MPQADLSYSAALDLDPSAMLGQIEQVMHLHDATAGPCKGRAHPVGCTHHDHVSVQLRMLRKPHRDDAFMQTLLSALQTALTPGLPAPCVLSIELGFLSPHYASVTLA
jgi:hypothetical protein